MLDDLILYQKIYDFILWFFPIINKFPKQQRFVLGQQIENQLVEMIKTVACANREREKLKYIQQASIQLDIARMLIRLAKDMRFISIRQYELAAERMNEVGRLLTGWTKKYS